MKILYFFLINFSKFTLIFATAFNAAAPLRSVVDEAALAEVFGTLDVFVDEIWTKAPAWFKWIVVNEIPNFNGVIAIPVSYTHLRAHETS